jgi:hypothetical protein
MFNMVGSGDTDGLAAERYVGAINMPKITKWNNYQMCL